jgi:excisionase family DNA binding protein
MKATSRIFLDERQHEALGVQWLRTTEVARLLGVSIGYVRGICKSGLLPSVQLPGGKHRRIHPEAFAKFLDQSGFNAARKKHK